MGSQGGKTCQLWGHNQREGAETSAFPGPEKGVLPKLANNLRIRPKAPIHYALRLPGINPHPFKPKLINQITQDRQPSNIRPRLPRQ